MPYHKKEKKSFSGLFANKLIGKIPGPQNKEHFQSFVRNKNLKSVKQ